MNFCFLKIKRSLLLAVLAGYFGFGCGPLKLGSGGGAGPADLTEEMRSVEQVQYIYSSQSKSSDSSTRRQANYVLDGDHRLLVKYLGLQGLIGVADVERGKLFLRISLVNPDDAAVALKSIKVLPLMKDWLPTASWYFANPFVANPQLGRWGVPGGDVDLGGEILATSEKPKPEPVPSPAPPSSPAEASSSPSASSASASTSSSKPQPTDDKRSLYFDIGDWYINYIKARGGSVNYGLAIISTQSVQIFGDGSGTYSPRIYWNQKRFD